MSKFEVVLVRVAYVAKLLIGVAGMLAVALLGMDGVPDAWQFPLQAVATVAAAVALFKVPNGPSVEDVKYDRETTEALDRFFDNQKSQRPDKPDQFGASGGDIE
jgi:hypothetical protein